MIVYSNSCSFGASGQGHDIYPELVANHFDAQLINKGRPGSCNRRIVRTTVRDLLELKEKHHSDRMLCLLGLSFISRTELWQPSIPAVDNDGNFHPITVDHLKFDWTQGLVDTLIPDIHLTLPTEVQEYYKNWLINMSKESIITDLLADIIMLEQFCSQSNIRVLIWSNAQLWPGKPEVAIDDIFIKPFVNKILNSPSVIDPWKFCFLDYALSQGYRPKDEHKYGTTGHPGQFAHKDFSQYLIKHLERTL